MRKMTVQKRSFACLLMLLGAFCLLCSAPATAGTNPNVNGVETPTPDDHWTPPAHVDNELVVKLVDLESAAITEVNSQFGTSVKQYFPQLGIYLLQTAGEDEFALARQVSDLEFVELAHPNYIVDPLQSVQGSFPIPDEMLEGDYLSQPAVTNLNITEAHTYATGANVRVAVIDGGIDFSHEALEGRAISGYDYVDHDADAFDESGGVNSGHGTFVAGIIHLIAPDAELRAYRVSELDGTSNGYVMAEAIMQAVVDGCHIINLSLVTTARHEAIASAIEFAEKFNVLVVAAAGNGQHDSPLYPASDEYVVAVGAVDDNDFPAEFSNLASYVDVWAPGEAVYSPYQDGYAWWSGTSFSAPFVAGQAALIYSKDVPVYARNWVVDAIMTTASDFGPEATTEQSWLTGSGVANPLASLMMETPFFINFVDPNHHGDVLTVQQGINMSWSTNLIGGTTDGEFNPCTVEISESASFIKGFWGEEFLPGIFLFNMDANGLPLGVYQDTIRIFVDGAYNNPAEFIYTLNVVDCTVPGKAQAYASKCNWNIWGGDETTEEHTIRINAYDKLLNVELNEAYTFWTDANPEFITNVQVMNDPELGDGVTEDWLEYTFDPSGLAWGQSYYDTVYIDVANTYNSPIAVWFHCYVRPPDTMSVEWLEPFPGGSVISWDPAVRRYILDIGEVPMNAQHADTISFGVNFATGPQAYTVNVQYPEYQDLTTYGCVDIGPTAGMTDDIVTVVIDWSEHTFTEPGFHFFWWEVAVANSLTAPWTVAINFDMVTTQAAGEGGEMPYDVFNYPNPFNPVTTLNYSLAQPGEVKLEVFNITGQRVRLLVDGFCEAGKHSVVWDGTDAAGSRVASGIYLYRLQAGEYTHTKKMVLLK